MHIKKQDSIIIVLLGIILFFFWWPTRDIPYWWDSAGQAIAGAKAYQQNLFRLHTGLNGVYAHPPLMSFLIAVSWKLFGESLFVSHVLNFIFTFIILVYTYLIGKELLKTDKQTRLPFTVSCLLALMPTLFLLYTPVFLAQLGIVYLDIPLAAFALMTVYYYFKKNIPLYIISATLMLFMKEVGFYVIGVLAAAEIVTIYLLNIRHGKKTELFSFLKQITPIILPVFFVALWFIHHKFNRGYFFRPEGTGGGFMNITPEGLIVSFKFFFVDQWRILITLGLFFLFEEAAVKTELHKYLLKWEVLIISLIILATPAFFGLTEFLHRYIIIGLPFFYLLFSYLLISYLFGFSISNKKNEVALVERELRSADQHAHGAAKQWVLSFVIIGFLCFLFRLHWNDHRRITSWYFPPLEDNLEYLDVIEVGKAATQYLEKNFPQAHIYTSFPSNYMFAYPYQGYTKKALNVKDCNKVRLGQKVDIVVFHPYSPVSQYCLEMIRILKFEPHRNIEKNGKFMSIYKKK